MKLRLRTQNQPRPPEKADLARVARVILEIASTIPPTKEVSKVDPRQRANDLRTAAALKVAAVSGAMALPPGPWGLATMIPDLYAVWRIQSQLIADIAGVFGKSASLGREQMLYCLFRHAASQILRDLVDRVGKRVTFRRVALGLLQAIARALGVKLAKRLLAKYLARWVPLVGSAAAAGYAYHDTRQVGRTAIELFETGFDIEPDDRPGAISLP